MAKQEEKDLLRDSRRESERLAKRIDEPIMFQDLNERGKPKKTILNFKILLFSYDITMKLDQIKKDIVFNIGDSVIHKILHDENGNTFDQFITFCLDICYKEGLPATRTDILNWVSYIANEYKFNAVKERLLEIYSKHKGCNGEFEDLMSCIKFKDDDEFSKLLFKKSLWQSIAMIHNENGLYGADGALTIQGSQGIGKTSLLRKLCEPFDLKYFKEGAAFDRATMKDDIIQNTSVFMCELGEAASTISMVDWMKRFITNSNDEVRPPYGIKKQKYPRLTSFWITINDSEFLKDDSNRRYWTIQLLDIDLNGLNSINYEKVWCEIYELYLKNNIGFRLTVEERNYLNDINKSFRKITKEEQVLRDSLDWSQPIEEWQERSATEIATVIESETYQKLSPNRIGVALTSIGYSKDSEKLHKRTLDGVALYLTPMARKKVPVGNAFDKNDKNKVISILDSPLSGVK